jgi:hypothetical protein
MDQGKMTNINVWKKIHDTTISNTLLPQVFFPNDRTYNGSKIK